MRVALLSHNAQAGDAIGRQIAEKMAFFADRGADIRLFVESDAHLHPGLQPFTHRFVPARPDGPNWAFLAAADLVIVEYSRHYPLLDLLPLLAGGRPHIVFDYHGVTPPNLGGANHRDALERGRRTRGLVWCADAALVHSRFTHDELRTATGFPADLTHSIGYAIDAAAFASGAAESPLRSQLRLPADARLLLFVGRLAPNKRVPVLVEALARLRERKPPVHAVIIGDSGGAYESERQRCRERAARLGVADRLHFLGHVDEAQLRNAYRDADALAIPSVHEGFCIPVVEAMACGTPVIAARAAALPETVGNAGLTFTVEDPADLARQIHRILYPAACPLREHGEAKAKRIAIVAPRFGDGFVGGAETSLRTLATRMKAAGHAVEVFTTGTIDGSETVDGLPVRRYRPDPADVNRHAAAAHALRLPGGLNDADAATTFLDHSLRSSRLVEALRERGPFDTIVVGPYLLGLTVDVAHAFRERVLLLPCFHDEPPARLPAFRAAFEQVGGMLYHSSEEQLLAEATLGLNHPNARVLGTIIDADTPGYPRHGRKLVGTGRRYLLYAGRFCREKGLPELLAYARRYAADHPERYALALIGEGDMPIPSEPWVRDLGYVSERVRRDVMSGADAFVTLSPNESLSLATLEAQAQDVPVIVRADNAVLRGHVERGHGGVAVDGYEAFAAALDDLWADPVHWRGLGRSGREYVRREFGDGATFDARWQSALYGLDVPLTGQLRQNGLRRAAGFDRPAWREQFGRLIDHVLDGPARTRNDALDIRPRVPAVEASSQQSVVLVPVRLSNRGQHPELAEGPARTELVAQVFDESGRTVGLETVTPLPDLLLPRRDVAAVVRVAVPAEPGEYRAALGFRRLRPEGAEPVVSTERQAQYVDLRVSDADMPNAVVPVVPTNLEPVLRAAAEAQQLPDGYADVSTGRLARLKCWLKRKLLHNFQHAYVNVLSRQQSAFNRQVLNAIAELADGQAALAHALAARPDEELRADLQRLRHQNRRLRRRLAVLENAAPAEQPQSQEAPA